MVGSEIAERLADLDAPGLTMRFHARGNVHGITPDVVGKASIADHTRGRRAAMDAGTQAELAVTERRLPIDLLHHRQRQTTDRDGALDLPPIEARCRHVAVTDRLDLVGPVALAQGIAGPHQ